jgi:hypothetical protein
LQSKLNLSHNADLRQKETIMKQLLVFAVVLGVTISSVSASARLRMMPSSNPCPVCTIGEDSAETISPATDSGVDASGAVTANDPSTDSGVDPAMKATPILF